MNFHIKYACNTSVEVWVKVSDKLFMYRGEEIITRSVWKLDGAKLLIMDDSWISGVRRSASSRDIGL